MQRPLPLDHRETKMVLRFHRLIDEFLILLSSATKRDPDGHSEPEEWKENERFRLRSLGRTKPLRDGGVSVSLNSSEIGSCTSRSSCLVSGWSRGFKCLQCTSVLSAIAKTFTLETRPSWEASAAYTAIGVKTCVVRFAEPATLRRCR